MKTAMNFLVTIALAGLLSGCAVGKDPRDPFEGFNRAMFTVNDKLDQYALKPTAEVYRDNVPSFVQTGVYNFFGNLGDVWTAVNNLLQGKIGDGVTDVMRVAVNTFLGFGGVLDIASEAGMQKHKQDFGATLGVWGVGSGPYVVLPIFGSSTLRDTVALPADMAGDVWGDVRPVWQRNTGRVLRIVDLRAGVLDAVTLIEEAALDRYEFVRDGYLQRREYKVRGDAPPKRQRDEQEEQQKEEQQKVKPVSSWQDLQEPREFGAVESAPQVPPVMAEGIRLRLSPAVRQRAEPGPSPS
nr:VacJ family lipoprotein [Lacisediminimonas profundi]